MGARPVSFNTQSGEIANFPPQYFQLADDLPDISIQMDGNLFDDIGVFRYERAVWLVVLDVRFGSEVDTQYMSVTDPKQPLKMMTIFFMLTYLKLYSGD